MSHPFDATLKELVAGYPDDYEGKFGLPAAAPVRVLNVDLSTVTAATDVALGFGEPLRDIVDLNFQSGADKKEFTSCTRWQPTMNTFAKAKSVTVSDCF